MVTGDSSPKGTGVRVVEVVSEEVSEGMVVVGLRACSISGDTAFSKVGMVRGERITGGVEVVSRVLKLEGDADI